jgi:transcriptional regulator with XRE-family HTH domain
LPLVELEISDLPARLRRLRRERGMTLAEVAADAGFTPGYLSQIENGLATPSLTALAVIAASLGSDVAAFFPSERTSDVRITRAGDPAGFRIEPNGHEEYVLLNGRVHGGEFTALIATHFPSGPVLRFRHTGEEHALVLEGRLRFEIDGAEHVVEAGGWIHYSSEAEHAAQVISTCPARVLWVLSPGVF